MRGQLLALAGFFLVAAGSQAKKPGQAVPEGRRSQHLYERKRKNAHERTVRGVKGEKRGRGGLKKDKKVR